MQFKTLLTLGRVSNLPTVWMNAVAATALTMASSGTEFSVGQMLAVLLGLSCLYAGGMSFNDYCDRHWDSHHQPFRPIPSGKASVRSVLIISLALFFAGLVFLAQSAASFAAAIGLLSLIIAYDILHKQFASSVFLMAATRFGVYIVAAFAISPSPPVSIFVLGGVQATYTLLVTVVARFENRLEAGFRFPLIPWMIAGMGIVDALALSWLLSPQWLIAGVVATLATRFAQCYVRGD